MVFMIPLNGVVASKMKKFQISQMKDKDKRCKTMDEILNGIKGGLISESFSLWLKSPKMVSNHAPDHYIPKEKMLRGMTWHPFWEF